MEERAQRLTSMMDGRQEESGPHGSRQEPPLDWQQEPTPPTPQLDRPLQTGTPTIRPITPIPERVYVYAPRDVKCPRFSGERANVGGSVEDWIREARKALVGQPFTVAEQVQWVCGLLDGEAKREVAFSLDTERASLEEVFAVLLDHFGCDQTYVAIQRQFFHRRQGEHESIREFTQALVALLGQLQQKDPRVVPLPDMVLRDTFIENIYNTRLHQELTQVLRAHPEKSFRDIREIALHWERRQAALSVARPATAAGPAAPRASARSTTVEAQTAQVTSRDIQECREALRQQQQQLDLILQRLSTSNTMARPARSSPLPRPPVRRPPLPFQPDGTPICLRCQEAGHIARHCPHQNTRPPPDQPHPQARAQTGSLAEN